MRVSEMAAYHYYDNRYESFSSISELNKEELKKIKLKRIQFLDFDQNHYIQIRNAVEEWLYCEFVKKASCIL